MFINAKAPILKLSGGLSFYKNHLKNKKIKNERIKKITFRFPYNL